MIIDFLLHLDYAVLKFLNVTMGDPRLDRFWMVLTHLDRSWIVRALALAWIAWGFTTYRWRFGAVVLVLAVAIGASDLICYRGLKHFVDRPRPFQNPEISSWLRPVGDAHGPSFPSNHAANTMAGAVVLAAYFERKRKYFYAFAALVAVSRCALGVHYPSDVLAGSLIGFGIGLGVCAIFLGIYYDHFALIDVASLRGEKNGGWRTRVRRLNKR